MSRVTTTHIQIDDQGVAWIVGANTKVVEVVLDKLAYGWSPEEIHLQHPHLSLAQIHSAFAYYYENKEKLDAQVECEYQEAEAWQLKRPTRRCGKSFSSPRSGEPPPLHGR